MDRPPTYAEIVARMPGPLAGRFPQDPGTAAGDIHLHQHTHIHQAPAVPDQATATGAADPGWALLHTVTPYVFVVALVLIVVGGTVAILAYVFTFVMGVLVVLVHSLILMAVTVVALVAVVAVLAGVLRPLFTGPSVTVQGKGNKVGTK